MVRFVHTADWQLGRRFDAVPGDAGALLRAQRMATVERIGELAAGRRADAVLVAGDVFEMNTVEETTLRRLLHVLARFDVPWLLLPGNHDPALAESAWTRLRRLGPPPNVRLCTTAEPIVLGALAVLPAPLARRHEPEDVTAGFADVATPEGAVRVGLAHGCVENRLPERSEAHNRIADDRAVTARLDYLALGDWHGALQIGHRTWYAGTPEPDRFRDNDPGYVLWVEVAGPGAEPVVEKVPVGHHRWVSVRETVAPGELAAVAAALAAVAEPHDRAVVSLAVAGTVDLATHRELELLVDGWRARFHHLVLDGTALHPRATDADLDRIARTGFVASAIARLRATAARPDDPERDDATLALELLYRAHVESGGA